MITPACGLATRSVADAERIIGEVREAQRGLKAEIDMTLVTLR